VPKFFKNSTLWAEFYSVKVAKISQKLFCAPKRLFVQISKPKMAKKMFLYQNKTLPGLC